MKTKHTVGKWRIVTNTFGQFAIADKDNHSIANLGHNTVYGEDEIIANAKLIAAAPEIIKAIQILLIAMKNGDITIFPENDTGTDYITILENAIKIATT